MGQEFGHSLVGSSTSTDCHQVSVRARVLSEGSTGKGSTPKLTWLWARFSTLQAVGLRASVPHWLICQKSPSVPGGPLHQWDHNMATCFIRASKQEKQRERERGHNLLQPNLNVKSYHICYILFIRSKSLHQANTPEKMIRQGHKC